MCIRDRNIHKSTNNLSFLCQFFINEITASDAGPDIIRTHLFQNCLNPLTYRNYYTSVEMGPIWRSGGKIAISQRIVFYYSPLNYSKSSLSPFLFSCNLISWRYIKRYYLIYRILLFNQVLDNFDYFVGISLIDMATGQ